MDVTKEVHVKTRPVVVTVGILLLVVASADAQTGPDTIPRASRNYGELGVSAIYPAAINLEARYWVDRVGIAVSGMNWEGVGVDAKGIEFDLMYKVMENEKRTSYGFAAVSAGVMDIDNSQASTSILYRFGAVQAGLNFYGLSAVAGLGIGDMQASGVTAMPLQLVLRVGYVLNVGRRNGCCIESFGRTIERRTAHRNV